MQARIWSKDQDDLIIKFYGKHKNAIVELKKHHEFFNFTTQMISTRARKLGVTRRTRVILTPEERRIIIKYAGDKSVKEIINFIERQTGIKRGYNSIVSFIDYALKMSAKADRYSLNDLIIGFRTGPKKIKRWVREGKLIAYRDTEGKGATYRFMPKDVAEFLLKHTFELEGCAVDLPWVLSLVLENRRSIHLKGIGDD
jgi:hypothetical protein